MTAAFQSTAFQNNAFQTDATPPPVVLHGGHFGFDEKRRRKRFDDELESEEARRNALLSAFGLLPEPAQEQIAAEVAPAVAGAVDWQPVIEDPARYAAAIQRIETKLKLIKQERDEENELSELIQLGVF